MAQMFIKTSVSIATVSLKYLQGFFDYDVPPDELVLPRVLPGPLVLLNNIQCIAVLQT